VFRQSSACHDGAAAPCSRICRLGPVDVGVVECDGKDPGIYRGLSHKRRRSGRRSQTDFVEAAQVLKVRVLESTAQPKKGGNVTMLLPKERPVTMVTGAEPTALES
jgi:hypothetical protein